MSSKKFSFTFISSVVLLGFLFPAPLLAQTAAEKEIPLFEVPNTLEGVKVGTVKVGKEVGMGLYISVKSIWHNEVLPVWRTMYSWVYENIWKKFIQPMFSAIGDSIKRVLGQEIENRKSIIKQELTNEKQELEQEIKTQTSQATRGLWERFKALFR